MTSNLKSSLSKIFKTGRNKGVGVYQRKLNLISTRLDIDLDKLTEDKCLFCLSSLGRVWNCRPFLIFKMLKFIEMCLFIRLVHLPCKLFLIHVSQILLHVCLKQSRQTLISCCLLICIEPIRCAKLKLNYTGHVRQK